MNRNRLILTLVILGIIPVSVGSVSAKGEWQQIIIRDAETDTAIEVHPESGSPLASFMVFEWDSDIPEPADPGIGYEIDRGGFSPNGLVFEPFDRIIYYPGEEDERSVMQYVGLIDERGETDGWSEYDGRWFYMMSDADADLRELLDLEPLPVRTNILAGWQDFRSGLILPFVER